MLPRLFQVVGRGESAPSLREAAGAAKARGLLAHSARKRAARSPSFAPQPGCDSRGTGSNKKSRQTLWSTCLFQVVEARGVEPRSTKAP